MQQASGKISTPATDTNLFDIRATMPDILQILLIDRTTSTPEKFRNIIWANDNYTSHDPVAYAPIAAQPPFISTLTNFSVV